MLTWLIVFLTLGHVLIIVLDLGHDKVSVRAISLPMVYTTMFFGRVIFIYMYLGIFITVTLLKVI